MRTVYFQNDSEVILFCEMLYRHENEVEIKWRTNRFWGNELQLFNHIRLEKIITCFIDIFLEKRLPPMIEQIITTKYYYTSELEIEKIIELTLSVLTNQFYEEKLFSEKNTLKELCYEHLANHMMHQKKLHYDSIITFCLQPIYEKIVTAVGLAIDEMKREQQYLAMMQKIREYIRRRQPKLSELTILQDESFIFYQVNGRRYTDGELTAIMERTPLYLFGLDSKEKNLSPVIALLPKTINIYGNVPTEPNTVALINLFEERVKIFPKNDFPYRLSEK